MGPLGLQEFVRIVQGTLMTSLDLGDVVVRHATTHSDRIHSASAFFALPGTRSDGHEFVERALNNGAIVAVVSAGSADDRLATIGRLVEVDDPLRALQRLAAWWRSQVTGRFVAVVGSNGKTITKDALVHFAGYGRSVYGSPGSYNSQLGVPLSILECPEICDIAVIEVAVSDPGEMAHLERIVRPDCVIVTNLGSRWQARFSSRSQQAHELLSMAMNIGEGGWVVIGQRDETSLTSLGNDTSIHRIVRNSSGLLPTFSTPHHDREGLIVDMAFPDGEAGRVCVRTPSEEILADVELAMSAAWLLGVSSATLLTASKEYRPTSTRMEIWRAPGGVTLVRDVATPDPIAIGSAIRAARGLVGNGGRAVVVLAEPPTPWDAPAADALARVLIRELARVICGLDTESHRELAAVVEALDVLVAVRLFESTADLRLHLLEDLQRGDVALLQSPPSRAISDLSTALMESMAPTRLYLDLSAIEENVSTFRRIVGPSVRVMGMVKALAYGTDSLNVSACLQGAGVDFLAVSGADEGAALRSAGISVPVLVMLGTGGELEKMLRYRLIPLIYSPEMLDAVKVAASLASQPVPVHIEVDTGMHRAGFEPDEAIAVIRHLNDVPGIRIEGLMTHFASADDPAQDAFTRVQLARFGKVSAFVRELGIDGVIRHAAATAATVRLPESHFDMVRIGLGLYGLHPSSATREEVRLTPALGLVSRIVEIIEVPEGERVGYGGTYVAPPGGGTVGVVPAGYHDCVPRAFSNFGYVIVAGQRCEIIGSVSMDSMTIDLSRCPDAHVGADVLIYGRYNDWIIPLEDVAETIGTIPYEMMARVGPRVQRIFTRH